MVCKPRETKYNGFTNKHFIICCCVLGLNCSLKSTGHKELFKTRIGKITLNNDMAKLRVDS